MVKSELLLMSLMKIEGNVLRGLKKILVIPYCQAYHKNIGIGTVSVRLRSDKLDNANPTGHLKHRQLIKQIVHGLWCSA